MYLWLLCFFRFFLCIVLFIQFVILCLVYCYISIIIEKNVKYYRIIGNGQCEYILKFDFVDYMKVLLIVMYFVVVIKLNIKFLFIEYIIFYNVIKNYNNQKDDNIYFKSYFLSGLILIQLN